VWVKVIAVLLVIAGAGCFWRSYAPRLRTHTELMVAIARKGVDLVRSGRLTAENMPELTYPLERAEAFARIARARAGAAAPPSLAAFDTLIARYRAFVDALDSTRRTRHGDEAAAALAGPLGAVEDAARAVEDALRAERRDAQPRGNSTTRLSSFTVASIVDTDCPSCGWTTCGASSASGRSTKRRLCISGCGIFSVRLSMTS